MTSELPELLRQAAAVRDGRGTRITYSPKVFIPLTQLCRDRCGYCTFAKAPARIDAPYLTPAQVVEIARAGSAAGCHEALNPALECHRGLPDKTPARRLATLHAAGELAIPFTTGVLVGIGETRADRIEALEAIAASHRRHGH